MSIFIVTTGILLSLTLLFYLFWLLAFRRKSMSAVPALAYHHVQEKAGFPATKLTFAKFEAQMLALKERGYRALSPDAFLRAAGTGADKSVFITFEDSYESVTREALPLLRSLEYTALIFVVSNYIGKPSEWDVRFCCSDHMTHEQIRRALDAGFFLGSHTKTHPDLTTLSPQRLREELTGSKKALEDAFGREVKHLSYPFGRYNRRVMAMAQEAGYTAAFTINRPLFAARFNALAVPMVGVYTVDSLRNFLCKVERGPFVWILDVRDKFINRFASGTALIKGGRPA
ncbi:MAG: polysaccharide deacetylase family protein [Fibrobacterota bacterium]